MGRWDKKRKTRRSVFIQGNVLDGGMGEEAMRCHVKIIEERVTREI